VDFFNVEKQTKKQKQVIKDVCQHIDPNDPKYYRATFEQTFYNGDDLLLMEEFWARFTKSLSGLLPNRFLAERSKLKAINFGTGTGAYQKAWASLGYQMFGIEHHDRIQELNDYGCDGIQASYYDMDTINSGTFDFGILDRAMFNGNVKLEHPDERFKEIFRVIKANGALIGILYGSWTVEAIHELRSYGKLSYRLTNSKKHPFLAFSVDRTVGNIKIDSFEKQINAISFLSKSSRVMLTVDIYQIECDENGVHHVLYIPTNTIYQIKSSDNKILIIDEHYFPSDHRWDYI